MPADALQIQYNDELKPLEKVLAQVRRSGEFVASGALAIPLPKLEVNGVGVISFPVPESQMAALIQRAVRAPYGRGQETILDTSVRKVWQVAPDQVRLGGKTWAASFETILARVTASLGCGEAAVSCADVANADLLEQQTAQGV